MKMNLPFILQSGMRILNIVNRTLPLVKEFNPAYNYISKKVKSLNMKEKVLPIINNSSNISNNSKNTNITNGDIKPSNNSLTFFK